MEDDEEYEEGDIELQYEQQPAKFTPSKRKKKQEDEYSEPSTPSTAPSSEYDWEESDADTVATSIDDGLPHPRVRSLFFSFSLPIPPPPHHPFSSLAFLPLPRGGRDKLTSEKPTTIKPFESRRDFFQRTSNEWQEVLMEGLRLRGIQPKTLPIKEIKTKAFELSEEKWWDCREEISALEEEQEAAGIGEVVSLADRAAGGGAGGAASGAGRRR